MIRARATWTVAVLTTIAFGCAANRAALAPRASTPAETITHVSQTITPSRPFKPPLPGVDNFGMVSADIWRGGRPNQVGMQSLKHLGVKTIIDLEDRDGAAEVPAGIGYVRLPVSAFRCDTVDAAALLSAIASHPKPIFIHCRQGRDRTGLAVAIYRCQVQGMPPADAIQELHNFNVNFWWAKPIEARIHALRATPQLAQGN